MHCAFHPGYKALESCIILATAAGERLYAERLAKPVSASAETGALVNMLGSCDSHTQIVISIGRHGITPKVHVLHVPSREQDGANCFGSALGRDFELSDPGVALLRIALERTCGL